MKLTELAPQFLRVAEPGVRYSFVETLEEAQGIQLLCAKCFETNDGAIGTHSIVCWFHGREVPLDEGPEPRWYVNGTGLDDLTLSPAISLSAGCAWQGWVTNGIVSSV